MLQLAVLLLVFHLCLGQENGEPMETRVEYTNECVLFCYFTPTETTRSEGRLTPDEFLNPQPCTHLVYGFANINTQHHLVPMSESDVPTLSSAGIYHDINIKKRTNPNLRTLLAVKPSAVGHHQARRGDLQDLEQPLEFLSNEFTRKTFIASARNFLREHKFDGMVIHLENPERSKSEFVQLLEDIKPMFEQESLISKKHRLSVVFSMTARQLDSCKKLLPLISRCVDYVYLETYENSVSENEFKTAYVNPLHSQTEDLETGTITHITRKAITNGISPDKLIVGVSLKGRSYVLNSVETHAAGAPASEWGYPGKYTNKRGELSYFEICQEEGRVLEDVDSVATSKVYGSQQWVSYNAPTETFRRKLRWIQNQGYAGVGLHTLDYDDFMDKCGGGTFTLVRTAADTLRCAGKSPPGQSELPQQPFDYVTSPLAPAGKNGGPSVRFCYFRPERDTSDFDFLNIGDPRWCTHIVLCFFTLEKDGTLGLSPALRLGHRMYESWRPVNQLFPGQGKPQLILGIGGFQGSQDWEPLVSSDSKRGKLIDNIATAMDTYRADGVDIHWTRDVTHKTGLSALISGLKNRLNSDMKFKRLVVSVTPAATYNGLYNFQSLAQHADYIYLLGHLFHFPEELVTGHHAAFSAKPGGFPAPRNTLRGLTLFWLGKGVPAGKLVVGATAEALTQVLTPESAGSAEIKLGLPTKGIGAPQNRTRRAGIASYMEVWMLLSKPFSRYTLLAEIGVPVGVQGDLFIAYDNSHSMQLKSRWSSFKRLGGVALWAVEYDDPWGLCPGGQKFPLMQKMTEAQIGDRCFYQSFPQKQESTTDSDHCSSTWRIQCDYHLPKNFLEPGQTVNPENLPWNNCTHLIVKGITISESLARVNTPNERDALPDESGKTSTYLQRLIRMREYGATSKLIVSARCDYDKNEFGDLLRSADFRSLLVRNLLAFIQDRDLDGLELDCDHVLSADLRTPFLSLLNQLSTTLKAAETEGGCPLLFSLRIPGWRLDLEEIYDVGDVNTMVDTASMEAFRYNSREDEHVRHHSPLYTDYATGQLAIHETVSAWRDVEKLDASKIILILPLHASTFELRHKDSYSIGSVAVGPGPPSRLSGETGKAAYWEVCQFLDTATFTRDVSIEQVAAFAYEGTRWIAYETPETAIFKLNYAAKYKLGGVGVSSLNEADSTGVCRLGPFPVVTTLALKCD